MSELVALGKSQLAEIKLTSLGKDVYGPSEDSFGLADALLAQSLKWDTLPHLCVEVGSGSGYVITSLARILQAAGATSSRLIATDISPAALTATKETLEAHKIWLPYEVVQADLLGGLLSKLRQQVDLLLFNPPYVPTPDDEISKGGIAAAWAGGARGRVVIDRLLDQLDDILSPAGQLFMVTVEENNPTELIDSLRDRGFHARVCLKQRADEELLHIMLVVRSAKS
mmetsp:Transcript_7158/g.20996  ORF Transcript_7158/g.20996 Transcript_7158/m.20996 type:complete len:227 (-) Transcript_7158:3398-4078(-)